MTKGKSQLPAVLLLAWFTYTAAYLCRVNISTALDKLAVGGAGACLALRGKRRS